MHMAERSPARRTRVFIADDHAIMRKGLRDLILAEPEFDVCGEAANGTEALKKIEELLPDIVVTDVDMPQMSGIDIAVAIRKKNLDLSVIMLTMYDNESFYTAAMDAGVKGYVLKDGAVSDIVQALKAVNEGKYYISPALSSLTIGRVQEHFEQLDGLSPLAALTLTERKILRLIGRNKSTKEIAEELFVSNRTIDSHRSNIAAKLNLRGNNALLRFALEHKDRL
jgi:two-component system response regulator DegU